MDLQLSSVLEKDGFSNEKIVKLLINEFIKSKKREFMITGMKYYNNNHDILTKDKKNNKTTPIVDNQYGRIIDQKGGYLFSNGVKIVSELDDENELLQGFFDNEMVNLLRLTLIDAMNCGVAYLYPYIENNEFKLRKLKPQQVIPMYRDEEKKNLDLFLHFYSMNRTVSSFFGSSKTVKDTFVEVYTKEGIAHFEINGENERISQTSFDDGYISVKEKIQALEKEEQWVKDWGEVPLIPLRFTTKELPYIIKGKGLQDALNKLINGYADKVSRGVNDSILVLKNYDGQDKKELQEEIDKIRIFKVSGDGGAEVLNFHSDPEEFSKTKYALKKALIENLRGVDLSEETIGTNPNQMNIQSMYTDIDIDANVMEESLKEMIASILYFYNVFLSTMPNSKKIDGEVSVTFQRNGLVNNVEVIDNIVKSINLVSTETLLSKHPYVSNVEEEMRKKRVENDIDSHYTEIERDEED